MNKSRWLALLKYGAIALAAVIALLLIIPFFIDVNSYRPQIVQTVEEQTGRKAEIGNISLSLFPWVGFSIEAVKLGNRPGFATPGLMALKSLEVRAEFWPLLDKKVVIKRFVLDSPSIWLERNAQGQGNWEEMVVAKPETQPAAPEQSKAADGGLPFGLNADALVISNATLVWRDLYGRDATVTVNELNLEVTDLQLERPVALQLTAKLGSDPLELNGRLGPLGDLAKLDAGKLPAQIQLKSEGLGLAPLAAYLPALPAMFGDTKAAKLGFDIQAEQRPDGVRISVGNIALLAAHRLDIGWKLDLPSADKLRLNALSLQMDGSELLSGQGEVNGLTATPAWQFRLALAELSRDKISGWVPALAEVYAKHPAPWNSFKMGLLVAGNSERVDIRDMQLFLNGELLQGSGSIGFAGPSVALRLSGRELHLDPWLPNNGESAGGKPAEAAPAAASAPPAAEPDLRFLEPYRIALDLQLDKLAMHGLELGRFRVNVNGNGGRFSLDPLRFDISGGRVEEKATLYANRYPAEWSESMRVSGVKVGPVLKVLAGIDTIEGTVSLDSDLTSVGILPDKSMTTMNGAAKVKIAEGMVKGFNIAAALRNLTNPNGDPLRATDFSEMTGSFVIRNGVATNADLYMASPMFRLTGGGVVDLPKQNMDWHVKPKLIGSLLGQGDTEAARKGLAIPLRIHGPFADPTIRPDVTAQSVLQNVGQALGGKAAAVDAAQKLLGGGSDPYAQKPAIPVDRQGVEKAIGGALKGLFR